MVFVRDIQKAGFYAALIRHAVNISRFKKKLLDPFFSYAAVHFQEQFGQRNPCETTDSACLTVAEITG